MAAVTAVSNAASRLRSSGSSWIRQNWRVASSTRHASRGAGGQASLTSVRARSKSASKIAS
jgi:hypothetical protein